jgi:hypothetical protein
VYFVFAWLSLAFTFSPLLFRSSVEPVQYRATTDTSLTSAYSRSFYSLFFIMIDIIARETVSLSSTALSPDSSVSPSRSESTLLSCNDTLRVLFCLLPLLFFFGMLSPVDALFPYLLEQLTVFMFGGTFSSSDKRIFLQFLVSVSAVIGSALLYRYVSGVLMMFVALGLGFLLAHNLLPLATEMVTVQTPTPVCLLYFSGWHLFLSLHSLRRPPSFFSFFVVYFLLFLLDNWLRS